MESKRMSNYIIPNLFEQGSVSSFFSEFVALNSHKKSFSQRSFSMKIGWPISCISDFVSGRRNLTVERAIQFGDFVCLSPIDLEMLIYLAIDDTFPDKRILNTIRTKKSKNQIELPVDDLLLSASSLLILLAILWLKEDASLENIILVAKERHISAEDVESLLEIFVTKGHAEFHDNIYQLNLDSFSHFTEKPEVITKLGREFNDFLRMFFENAKGPSFINNSLLILHESKFNEIAERAIAFKNWLMEISREDAKLPRTEYTRIYQLDINLTAITNSLKEANT
jgi:hypothetical protein